MNSDIEEDIPFINDSEAVDEPVAPPGGRARKDVRRKIEQRNDLLYLRSLLDDPLFDDDLD